VNRSAAIPLLVALLALSTLAVAASTLETTVTTDPDDEIDPPWEKLPISQDTAATMQAEINGDASENAGGSADSNDGTADSGDGTGASGGSADGAGGGSRGTDGTAGGAASSAGGANAAGGAGSALPNQSLLDRLLAFLAMLLQVLLGLVVVGGVAGLAYRYRERYRSLFGFDRVDIPAEPTESPAWPASEPTTAVDRAWVRLVGELDPDQPETTTPADCRRLAHNADLDTAAVEAITTAFERVHYGGYTPADEQPRAKSGLDRLTGDEPTGGSE